ncbi:MAG: Coenzyme F420 hydrogenase/dehydrogenase, beta subunit C-terminal domain [Desulfobacterales bacterium]|nr:Coenzyme F420 hydrogenase/dehydrogenase, beta subunit C-terminal domain [Desulfobacterales bacterium]
MDTIWCHRYFTPNACNFCDDVFAECADVVFMNAWLPEYFSDYRGYNIVLIRDLQILEVLAGAAKKKEVFLKKLDVSKAISSQQGVLTSKQGDILERLHLTKVNNHKFVPRRIHLLTKCASFTHKHWIRATLLISRRSSVKWGQCDKDLHRFKRAMTFLNLYVTISNFLDKFDSRFRWIFRSCLRNQLRRERQ